MKKGLLYIMILLTLNSRAQVPVTLTAAIDSALKSNFDIRIARVNSTISKVSNTYGMAGGLPSLNGSATDNKSLINLKQKTSSGLDITKNGVNSSSLNAGLTANMVLFNGFKVIAAKGRLNFLQRQGELLLNQQIQNTIAATMVTYYDIL